MIGENRQLVANEPVEVHDCRKITDHFRGIYWIYRTLIKENQRMWTCNRLDLQAVGSEPVMPKNLPDHWLVLRWSLPQLRRRRCCGLVPQINSVNTRELSWTRLTSIPHAIPDGCWHCIVLINNKCPRNGERISDRGDFWPQPVEILVFASPTGYMFTSSGFPLSNWGIFYKFL